RASNISHRPFSPWPPFPSRLLYRENPVPAPPERSPAMATAATETKVPSKFETLVAKYRKDHTHPINNVMHVGIGWPMVAAALLLVPFRPWWSLALFLGGYAVMFTGHFVFEKN